jgi:hypothetical protein
MIKFGDTRKTVTIELESYKGTEVVVYTKLQTCQQRDLLKSHPDVANDPAQQTDFAISMALYAIKEWNFSDENDKPLTPSKEILEQLPISDLMQITECVKMAEDDKKK